MDAVTIILIAFGLAMDAFAVSIANGLTITKNRPQAALLTAGFFGGFQMLMPAIGWLAGFSLQSILSSVGDWIAFVLLAFIGGKMIYDGVKNKNITGTSDQLKLHKLLLLSVATSIDALLVGFSFAFIETAIFVPILVIGGITFLLSYVGFSFGTGLGEMFGERIKIVGGIILVLIGLKILLENLAV
ncbi:MAG: manganese efflux pump MntP family protein [Candidatus Bathyarchaeota archaeon]|nr:manganese efflux pump MntP family protein [Candidatus Bathyarchaeota archaeon]